MCSRPGTCRRPAAPYRPAFLTARLILGGIPGVCDLTAFGVERDLHVIAFIRHDHAVTPLFGDNRHPVSGDDRTEQPRARLRAARALRRTRALCCDVSRQQQRQRCDEQDDSRCVHRSGLAHRIRSLPAGGAPPLEAVRRPLNGVEQQLDGPPRCARAALSRRRDPRAAAVVAVRPPSVSCWGAAPSMTQMCFSPFSSVASTRMKECGLRQMNSFKVPSILTVLPMMYGCRGRMMREGRAAADQQKGHSTR